MPNSKRSSQISKFRINMTLQEFKNEVLEGIKEYPSDWRYGQKVFNYIDSKYHVAREVQFDYNIDCFYRDDLIDEFIEASYKLI